MARSLCDCKVWRDDNFSLSPTSEESPKLMYEVLHQLYEFTENYQYSNIKGSLKL